MGFAFGAILAYEVARAIADASGQSEGAALLVAVSAEGPSWPGRKGSQHKLDEPGFISMLKKKGGTEFILRDAGLTKMCVRRPARAPCSPLSPSQRSQDFAI